MGDVMGDVVSYFYICYLYSNILLVVVKNLGSNLDYYNKIKNADEDVGDL